MSDHHSLTFYPHFRCPCTCRPPPCLNFQHHHHHYHHRHPSFCPFHSRFLCHNFHTHFPAFSIPPPFRGNPVPGSLLPTTVFSVPASKDANFSTTGLQEGSGELCQKVKEEEEEDPVFVMTDEWMEFFAKSEAKRRLDRQAKKRSKK